MKSKIKLSRYGTFLSGRSLPAEIIKDEKLSESNILEIDFSDIPAVNQSFLSQFFVELQNRGFSVENILCTNVGNIELAKRIELQLDIVFERKDYKI